MTTQQARTWDFAVVFIRHHARCVRQSHRPASVRAPGRLAMTKKNQTKAQHIVTSGEVAAIAALKDPVLRNLKITLAYHDITLAMAELFGRDHLTWCAFASWASKTVGFFIR